MEFTISIACTWCCAICCKTGASNGPTAQVEAASQATAHVLTRHPDR